MSFWNIVENVLIGPLKLVFEVIFQLANRFIGHPGLSIVVLSLVMNILVLPLYKRADAMQEESRDIEMKLKKGVDHIKKSFTGDERMMILQTYYRQNNYKPTDALNGSVSLLLEIPFFMAAYQFLSNLGVMDGVSLGPIADLSKPDGLLVIGSLAINVLPVLMTLVNVISSAIYLKGFPLKTKIQLYGMALFFLVFLYESPACLVFYWTLNNVFSLVKTIFYKIKNPGKVLKILIAVVGAAVIGLGIAGLGGTMRQKVFIFGLGAAMQLPWILGLVKKMLPAPKEKKTPAPNKGLFILGCVFLTILVGVWIPSVFLSASPQEYVDVTTFYNPLWYLVSAACLSAGTFLVWLRVFYWLASPKGKVLFERIVWVLSGVMLVNYMFFGTNLGLLSPELRYLGIFAFTAKEQLLNLLVVVILAVMMYLLVCRFKKAAVMVLLTAAITVGAMSAVNIVTVHTAVQDALQRQEELTEDGVSFSLSKTGKNVIVVMLDRALGQQIPYIFNEKPELQEQFSGFVHYRNTLSFGTSTNTASPALFGGYEYTPVEMNRRDQELLVTKHNEALKMMPTLFAENDFDVTVIDPPYANYQWLPDLSVFSEIPGVKAYVAKGVVGEETESENQTETVTSIPVEKNKRNFFVFSLMKTMPLVVQPTIYDSGNYNRAPSRETPQDLSEYYGQQRYGTMISEGVNTAFMQPYNVLCHLPEITQITEDSTNTFLCMTNDTTHDPMLLQAPDYTPSTHVDNTQYEKENAGRFTLNGITLNMETEQQMIHYYTNMAVMIKLGQWFDYMRQQGVYDNTRIILVSDHGRAIGQVSELIMDDGSDERLDLEYYAPLLMVKDFGAEGFTTSSEFMTNADVPTLAVTDLIEDPVNPYTGKALNNHEKTAHPQYVLMSVAYDVNVNNGTTYLPDWWALVENDIWDQTNWTIIDKDLVLDEYKLPE